MTRAPFPVTEKTAVDELKAAGIRLQDLLRDVWPRIETIQNKRLRLRAMREASASMEMFNNTAQMLTGIDSARNTLKTITGLSALDLVARYVDPICFNSALNIGASLMTQKTYDEIDKLMILNGAIDKEMEHGKDNH